MKSKTLMSIVFLFAGIWGGCDQHKNLIADQREKEVSGLIRYYVNHELKRDSIFLFDKSTNLLTEICIDNILAENKDINLKKEDILNMSQKDTLTWSNKLVPIARIISNNALPIINSLPDKIRDKEGQLFYLANPIFSKDFSYAILQSSFVCGSRCGERSILLFKKEKDSWTLLKTYCKIEY
ncbi:hypothetical protein [Pedobacter cryoconitis]|nr:hypothetical protein [Pedobacter cryoconitis]